MALVKGIEIGDNGTSTTSETLKNLAQQNTQNPITQSTDTATSTPLSAGVISSQGKQIVNTPSTVQPVVVQPIPETPTTAPVTNTLGLPDPQYPSSTVQANAGQVPNNTPYPSPSGSDSIVTPYNPGTLSGGDVNGPAAGASLGVQTAQAQQQSGGGGGGSGYGGTDGTSSTTTTTTSAGGETTAEQPPAWKEYFDKANSLEFAYDPSTDNAYKLAASQVEQQVTDMMVGRGGLYSSVAQSALTSRLMELQVSYEEKAYERFLEDRNYYMELASFVADREDTAFEQSLALDKFKADLDQQKFENNIAMKELAIQQANAAYSRQYSKATEEQEYSEGQLGIMQVDYDQAVSTYNELVARWKSNDVADYEIASFFGVATGTSYSSGTTKRNQAYSAIQASASELVAYARKVENDEAYLLALEAVKAGSSSTSYSTTTTQTQANYDSNYTATYNLVVGYHRDGKSWDEIKTYVMGKSTEFKNAIGTTNYNLLISYLTRKQKEE